MKYITPLLLLLVLIFSFQGCEKEIPFDSEVSEPKLVLNSLFTSDSVWKVHVSQSLSVLDNNDLNEVLDAMVSIKDEAGATVANLAHQGDGLYEAATEMPVPSQTYRIDVSAPGYEPVSATDAIPGAVQILSLDTTFRVNEDSTVDLDIELTFTDPAGESNFYMIDLIHDVTFIFGQDTFPQRYNVYLNCTDPNIETDNSFSGGGFEDYYQYILLKDAAIDGRTYTLKFTLDDWYVERNFENTLTLSLIASSEAFFNYRRSYQAFSNTQGNPFSQPVQVFSNVEGGHGIFAGGTREIWEIEF